MSSNWAAWVNSYIWGQGKQVRWKFPPQAAHGGTRAKGACRAQTQPLLCSCYQKSAGTHSETLGNSQSGQDVEEQTLMRGQEDLCNQKAAVKPPYPSLQKDLSTWRMGQFWKTESSFRHQNWRSGHIVVFVVFISPNILHNDHNEHQ